MAARNRLWVIGSVAAMVVIVLLAWFIGVAPQLASIATINAQQASVDAQNAREQAVLDRLEEDAANEQDLMAEWKLASSSVPSGTGVPRFIDQLHALAASTGVTITRITVSDAAPFVVTAPVAADADAASTETSTDASGAAAPTGIDASNFAFLQVGIEVAGEYPRILEFVNGLQTGERLMLVNDLDVSSIAQDPNAVPVEGEAPVVVAGYDARVAGYIYSLVDASRPPSRLSDLGRATTVARTSRTE